MAHELHPFLTLIVHESCEAFVTHLAEMRDERERDGKPSFEVVAYIDGRGFGVRRTEMKKLIKATRGKYSRSPPLIDLWRTPRCRSSGYR